MASEAPSVMKKARTASALDAIRRAWKKWWIGIVVGLLLVLPLIAVGAWLHGNDRWAPVYDNALTEMRVRDVGTVNTPLVGLPGRLGRADKPQAHGSHPGPLSFYLLAPIYRLLGGSYWALRVSTATLNALAIVSALSIAGRRAGTAAVIVAGLAIGLLELGYGLLKLTEPWNPNLPLLWFVVCLLGVWSVACEDVRMLPVVALSASFCAQTHVPYFPVCGALGLLAFILAGASWLRARRLGSDARQHARAFLLAIGLTVVVWVPPLIEQRIHDPGNLALLLDYFAHPSAAAVGFRSALGLLATHLDAWHLTVNEATDPGTLGLVLHPRQPSAARGAVLLVLFAAGAALAMRLENRALVALHGVLAASLVIAWIAISRITGVPWPYLTYWAWAIGVGLLFAVTSTAALGIWRRMPERWRNRSQHFAVLGLSGVALVCLRLLVETRAAGSGAPAMSAQLHELAPDTAAYVRRSMAAATGDKGRYLVTWSDALNGGAQGLGLVNELERRGVHAGIPAEFGKLMTAHRVLERQASTARIHLATGPWVSEWRRTRGAIEVAFSDPRSTAAREEYARLREAVIVELRKRGRMDLADALDWDLSVARAGAGDPLVFMAIGRMIEIGGPAAVFIVPAGHLE